MVIIFLTILTSLTGLSALAWLLLWTFIRWQRIIKDRNEEWWNRLWWILLSLIGILVIITTIVWAIFK